MGLRHSATSRARIHDAALERLLASPHLAADDALIALAERFAGCDRAAVVARLDDVARGLFGTATLPPRAQADRLAGALCDTLGLRPVTHASDALLVDRALTTRRAHPLVIAAVGHELARRAGLERRVCRARTDWWLTLLGDGVLTAIGCSSATTHPCGPLEAVCPHQLAYALLAHLGHDGPAEWHELAERFLPSHVDRCARRSS
ncbi:MAG TPA: hypothetical protein VFG31_02980 [Conexibacter sp.]|nr:hypothetical protein [Conexibacter sp.]